MSDRPKAKLYKSLGSVATKLRSDLEGGQYILLFANNRTGKFPFPWRSKTQESASQKTRAWPIRYILTPSPKTCFSWNNDLEEDQDRHLCINSDSRIFAGLKELALEETIPSYLSCYADFGFDIDYTKWTVRFRNGDADNIKVSSGEENTFIWCLFLAICERVLGGHVSYQWVKYLYIDDPISSLDDNNAIAVACDLAGLLRKTAGRKNESGESDAIKTVFSSHHGLFFNVMCNELGRAKAGQSKIKLKRYFLHRPNSEGVYTLRATEDTPFFHHVATLAELQKAADSGDLCTHHFNALRSILEKTVSFLAIKICAFASKISTTMHSIIAYSTCSVTVSTPFLSR